MELTCFFNFLELFQNKLKKSSWLFSLILFFGSFSSILEATYIELFNTTTNGSMVFTGNTLGLTKQVNQNKPGTSDADGAFITTDTTQQVNNYLPGTTLDWKKNSSYAFLDLPSDSAVVYAALIWSGSYGFNDQITGNEPDTPVTLINPDNVSYNISPNSLYSQNAVTPGFMNMGNYVRAADITGIVQGGGAGMYTVGGVAATISPFDNTHNAAGWTLAVVYQNGLMLTNNMTIFAGCEQASYTTNQPAQVSGFCVPPSGSVSGTLFISAIEGDCNKTGDHMLFGPTNSLSYPANSLEGGNNPRNNFFCSQLNTLLPFMRTSLSRKLLRSGSGGLDTRGSFGTYNSNPFTATNGFGYRQGYDITSIDISNKIVTNQTTAYALGTTNADDYTINGLGILIQVGAPIIISMKEVNGVESVNESVGDTVTYTRLLSKLSF